ncbi:MAG: extracellular solute-binding protein [Nitrospirae bacterium]|nr:extracellular solute-binding protein [Nitrospirota bacterium]
MGIKMSDYVKRPWDIVKFNGKYYGIPLGIIPLGIFYNKDMFKKAGLDPEKPPRNLEEFIEYGKKLTKDTDGDGKIDQWGFMNDIWPMGKVWVWESILVQNGGSLLNAEKTKAAFNNKAGLDALNIMLDFSRKDKIAPPGVSDAGTAFLTGKAAMYISGIWMVPTFKDKLPLGTGALPQFGSQRPAVWSSLDLYLFPKHRRKDKERWKATITYTQWVAGPEGQKFYAQMFLPTRLDILNSPFVQADPYMSAFAKAVDSTFFPPALKDTQEIYDSIASPLDAAFAGTISAEEALAQAEKQTNRILARQ